MCVFVCLCTRVFDGTLGIVVKFVASRVNFQCYEIWFHTHVVWFWHVLEFDGSALDSCKAKI